MNDISPPRSLSRTVIILAPLLVATFGVVVALVLFEIGFRLFSAKPPLAWDDRPSQYFIAENSPTFQDYPHAPQKPPGTYRIAVIGDSFTFAPYMQFDDAFPKRLERWLNLNNDQPHVEVINYGVPAYSTNHEVPVVERALKEQADLIIMEITLNDPEIKPYTPTELWRDKNRFGELELSSPLYRYWSSLAFVIKRIHNRETRRNYKKKFFDLFEKPDTWQNFKGSWERIAAFKNGSTVPIVAVVFPLFGYPIDDGYPFWPIHTKVRSLMDSLKIPLLDISEIYRNIPLERLQVMPGKDFHPNEIAHRMAAEALYKWLSVEKTIPDSIVPKKSFRERTGITLQPKNRN